MDYQACERLKNIQKQKQKKTRKKTLEKYLGLDRATKFLLNETSNLFLFKQNYFFVFTTN